MTSDASPMRRWMTREQMRSTGVRFLRRGGILIPFLALFLTLSLVSDPFATKGNLLQILDQQSATLIIAAAGTLVLVAGGIDLSVGAVYGFAAVTAGTFAPHHSAAFAILAGIGAGLLVGLLNGIVVTVLRINSLIATLAMAFIINGCSSIVAGGDLLVFFDKTAFADFAQAEFLGVRTSIWTMLAAVIAIGLLLATTKWGRYMYAAGGNPEAARLAGVRVDGVRILTFAISGMAAGLAGVIATAKVLSAQAASNDSLTFTVLAAIVVGGTSILGGEGAVWRSVVGVLFIALIGNGYVLLALDPLYQQITLGVLLLAAVALDALARGVLRPGTAIKQLFRRRLPAP
jgi:ribose transport system permease protein